MAFEGCCELPWWFWWVPIECRVTRAHMRIRDLSIDSGTTGPGNPGKPNVKEFRGVTTTTGQCKIFHHLERQSICHHRSWIRRILCIPNHQRKCKCSYESQLVNNILQSVANLVGPVRSSDSTSTSSDVVTQLLVYGVSLFPSINLQRDQVASVARQVSLVLIGAIILSSLRQLMNGVKRACLVLCISGTKGDIHTEFCFRYSKLPTETLVPR